MAGKCGGHGKPAWDLDLGSLFSQFKINFVHNYYFCSMVRAALTTSNLRFIYRESILLVWYKIFKCWIELFRTVGVTYNGSQEDNHRHSSKTGRELENSHRIGMVSLSWQNLPGKSIKQWWPDVCKNFVILVNNVLCSFIGKLTSVAVQT